MAGQKPTKFITGTTPLTLHHFHTLLRQRLELKEEPYPANLYLGQLADGVIIHPADDSTACEIELRINTNGVGEQITLILHSNRPAAEVKAFIGHLRTPSLVETLHGVCIEMLEHGVLLIGAAGSGKSAAALALVERGYSLVADDVVDLVRIDSDTIAALAPLPLRGLLTVRGLGALDVAAMYGTQAWCDSTRIDLIIELESDGIQHDPLHPCMDTLTLMGLGRPCYRLPHGINGCLATWIEATVRYHQLYNHGNRTAAGRSSAQRRTFL